MRYGTNTSLKSSKSYHRALRVLARMRRNGETLAAASREEGTDPRTVKKYVGTDLRRLKEEGQTVPTKSDRRHRKMLIPTSRGVTAVSIHGSEQASRLGRYMAAVGEFLRMGKTDGLEEFEGQSVAGHPLITDPETLVDLAEAGSLQLDSIYALPESSS